MQLGQFTLKRLFAATALIAVGMALLSYVLRIGLISIPLFVTLACWFGGFAAIGAGLSMPFRQTRNGTALGVVVAFVVGACLFCAYAYHEYRYS
jgi:hypothetical protein